VAAKSKSGRFLDRLIDEMRLMEDVDRDVMEERFRRYWLKDERPEDRTPLRTLTKRERFFVDIFHRYGELENAVASLELSAHFIAKLRLHASADVLAYHVEKHLEETYILKERFVAFLRHIGKMLKKARLAHERQVVENLERDVTAGFEGIVRTRGHHVHAARFQDEDIKRVGSLDMMVKQGKLRVLIPLRRIHVAEALKKWRQTTKANVQEVKRVTEQLIEILEPIVFDKLAPPKNG
jgi:hypothetical protein